LSLPPQIRPRRAPAMHEPLYVVQRRGTPSSDDPPNAADFYRFLGTAIVPWGRLEGHFAASLIMALQLSQDNKSARKYPLPWTQRSKIWRLLFSENDALGPRRELALSLIDQIDNLAGQRDLIIHALWDSFVPTEPVKMEFITLQNRQGLIESRRDSIDLAGLTEFVVQANRLHIELSPVHQFLTDALAALRSKAQI
jgi:hypothetical protein